MCIYLIKQLFGDCVCEVIIFRISAGTDDIAAELCKCCFIFTLTLYRSLTSTEASTLPLHHTNTSEDDCFLTKFLFVATFDLRPDQSPVQ